MQSAETRCIPGITHGTVCLLYTSHAHSLKPTYRVRQREERCDDDTKAECYRPRSSTVTPDADVHTGGGLSLIHIYFHCQQHAAFLISGLSPPLLYRVRAQNARPLVLLWGNEQPDVRWHERECEKCRRPQRRCPNQRSPPAGQAYPSHRTARHNERDGHTDYKRSDVQRQQMEPEYPRIGIKHNRNTHTRCV